jgi:hypothetical protein
MKGMLKNMHGSPYHFCPYGQPTMVPLYYPVYDDPWIPYLVRQYPPVDITLFNKSAIAMQKLMKEASIVLNKIASSKNFAYKLMSAAQESKLKEVERLIQSTGVHSKVETSYTPDGINLKLSSQVEGSDCCHLTIALRWRA